MKFNVFHRLLGIPTIYERLDQMAIDIQALSDAVAANAAAVATITQVVADLKVAAANSLTPDQEAAITAATAGIAANTAAIQGAVQA